jgi:hypothetical protein
MAEYGFTLDVIKKMTRRELSQLIDALVDRKQGYKNKEDKVIIKPTDEVLSKIDQAHKKRFGG